MGGENYLELIEQLRHDRDKYIGMWRSQCTIAEEVMRERDRLTAELAEVKEKLNMNENLFLTNLLLELCELLTAELARYKQGVEVEVLVNRYGVLEAEYELPSHLLGKRVRVLVMKVEEET